MALTLVITNVPKLDNGVSTTLVLDRNGALIGRSAMADWSLPDPHSYISSTHCEIEFRDGGYLISDRSLNGTLVNGGPDRMSGPHRIANGDTITVGHYDISCRLDGVDRPSSAGPAAVQAGAAPAWGGWDRAASDPSADQPPGWGARAAGSDVGQGPSVWTPPPADPGARASPWSSPIASDANRGGAAVNIWEQLASSNVVDWARGGFGADKRAVPALEVHGGAGPAPAPRDPFGLDAASSAPSAPVFPAPAFPAAPAPGTPASAWGAPQPSAPPVAPAQPRPTPPAAAAVPGPPGDIWVAFLAACGVQPGDITAAPDAALQEAGVLLRQLVAGLVVLLEARARAKAQLGAQGTALEFDGNNPLKFARAPERAIAQLLNPPERGFMGADRAIEDAFKDLQAHQMATLAAMQGALTATLDRFSPESIRSRAESHGILAKVLPGARDAELWKAYEREFEGVSRGSDEAFMDVFAKEFRTAYERAAAEMKGR